MKTWKQIKNEALGLMFSNNANGSVIDVNDDSVKEYVINMPDAANYAIRDLSTAVPILKFYRYSQAGADISGSERYFMRKLALDFYRFAAPTAAMDLADVCVYGGYLELPKRFNGSIEIPYYAYANVIDENTPDNFQIDMDAECEDLIPLYMASRLYFEDDSSLAITYLNQYSMRRDELRNAADSGSGGEFVSLRGWI